MKKFELIIKLRATEGHRTHRAVLEFLDRDALLADMNHNLDGKFFAINAYSGGMLTSRDEYLVIINTSEIQDIMIDEVKE